MPEPVVFISHFSVKEGKLEELRALSAEIVRALLDEKPGTAAYLMYLDEEGSAFSVVHCFPDADALDRHFEGSDERSAAALELIDPRGWEIYGRPTDAALETMRRAAADGGVALTVMPDHLGGFLRLRHA